MQKNDTLRVNWRQAGGEALLLLIGVLLALAGQAWWEARVEREVGRELVDSFQLELQENDLGLVRLIGRHERYITAGTNILNAIQAVDTESSAEAIGNDLKVLGFISDFRPAQSALENFVGSGGFNLVSKPELRLAVLKYAQGVDDHNTLQTELVDFFFRSLIPTLSKNVPLLELQFVKNIEGLPKKSAFDFDLGTLSKSLEFENLVLRRVSAEQDALEYARALLKLSNELQIKLDNKK